MIIAEETTTLPEGATVSVTRESSKLGLVSTYLTAAHGRKSQRMRVDNIAPGSLRQYLELVVRVINKERATIKTKPSTPWIHIQTIQQFVGQMAYNEMFIFETLTDADLKGNPTIPPVGGTTSKQRKRKNHPADSGRHARHADGTKPSAGETA